MRILLLTLGLVACQQKPSPLPQESAPTVSEPAAGNKDVIPSLQATVRADPAPNRYRVLLTYRGLKPVHGGEWVLYREHEHQGETYRTKVPATEGEYSDPDVTAGETYSYVMRPLDFPETGPRLEAKVTIPRDLEVKQKLTAPRIDQIERLFLRSGGTILAGNAPLQITVNELISDGGTIAAFEENATAPSGATGRAAGSIRLRARRGSGILNLRGDGENGGPGLPGSPGLKGKTGPPGTAAEIAIRYASDNRLYRDNLNALVAEAEKARDPLDPSWREIYRCQRQPSNGGSGEPGGPGGKGGVGGKGGNGARILIEVANASTLDVRPTSPPGQGGAAGRGGPGGVGGEGGPAGSLDAHHVCPPAQIGANGGPGKTGDPGQDGSAGERGLICLHLGQAHFGDCEAMGKIDEP